MEINYLECPDGVKLFSFHRHDFRSHTIGEKMYAIDGGFDYTQITGDILTKQDSIENLIVDIREIFTWGRNYDKDMNRLPKTEWILLEDLDSDHILNIMKYLIERCDNMSMESKCQYLIFLEELIYRNTNKLIGYKGFDKDLKCLEYQYEIGKTFEMDVNKKLTYCPVDLKTQGGLHFCLNPLDVLTYYENVDGNRYAIVESVGDVLTQSKKTKVATNKLKVIREITYDELLQRGVKYSIKNTINLEINDDVFKKCPESLKEKYLSKCIEKGWDISDEMFEWCPEELKEEYVLSRIKHDKYISDEMFEWCRETLKEKYVLNHIETGYYISDKQFEWCSDELKEEFVLKRIEICYSISDEIFELCSETLKEECVLSFIKNGRDISSIMSKWYENFENNKL